MDRRYTLQRNFFYECRNHSNRLHPNTNPQPQDGKAFLPSVARTLIVLTSMLAPIIGAKPAIAASQDSPVDSVSQAVPVDTPKPAALYLQQAKSGSLRHRGDRWLLTLNGTAPRVTTFADRPQQVGGAQDLKSFLSGWNGAFGSTAPQAVLEITDAPASRDVILLELSAPQVGMLPGTITYEVRPLTQTSRASLAALAERADSRVSARFGRASLFIDATGGAVPFSVFWTSNGGTFGFGFDVATISSGSLMSIFTEGNYVFIGPEGIDGQSFNPTGLFQGSIQGRLSIPPSGPITGNANVPSGFTVQLTLCNGTPVTLPNGNFSVPAPTEGC